MGNYTPEQVEECAEGYDALGEPVGASMLRAYAATLRQQAGRVDVEAERAAYERWFDGEQGKPYDGCYDFGRAAWPHLAALAQNTQGEAEGVAEIFDALPHCSERTTFTFSRDKLQALVHHAERARVPDGMVLVPREPTEEMLDAGRNAVMARDCSGPNWGPADHYRAAGISRDGIPDRLLEGKGKMSKAWGAELVYHAMLAAAPSQRAEVK